MAGADVAQSSKAEKSKGGRRKKRRIHIRIDMTPMVDIVMLLLIFYMVTTVFSMPQAMEINLPSEDEIQDVEVAESKLLTFWVDGENRFFWTRGNPAKNLPQLIPSSTPPGDTTGYQVDVDSLRSIMISLNREVPKLNTLMKIHPDAQYQSMVDFLDEVDMLERSWNAAIAEQKGVKVDKLTKEDRFSYRYAMDDWQDVDDRIVQESLAATMQEEQAALGGE